MNKTQTVKQHEHEEGCISAIPILETFSLSYTYQGKHRKMILEDLNLSFQAGTFYAVVGPSGSGKTTPLSLLAGLDSPTEGYIALKGERISPKRLADYRRDNVALVFQNYNLIDYLTPRENVLLGGPCDPTLLLRQVGIEEANFDRNVLKLSGGQQQRVAIARALAHRADILLADEPTGNLDGNTAKAIVDILERCAHDNGTCVIVVTHSPQLAERADEVVDLETVNQLR